MFALQVLIDRSNKLRSPIHLLICTVSDIGRPPSDGSLFKTNIVPIEFMTPHRKKLAVRKLRPLNSAEA